MSDDETVYYNLSQSDLYEGEKTYIRLNGSGINSKVPVHQILNKLQDYNNKLDYFCDINQGVVSGCDSVTNKILGILKESLIEKKDGIFVFDMKNKRDLKIINSFTNEEKKFLRPFFKNSDISRYWCQIEPMKYMLYYNEKIDLDKYPNMAHHLNKFKKILEQRLVTYNEKYHWTELHRPRKESIFLSEKIVVPYRARCNSFAYNNVEWFCRSDSYVITKKRDVLDLKYILGLLNSKLYFIWLYNKGKRKGDILELFQTPLSEIPIKEISSSKQTPFIALVDQILDITIAPDYLDNPQKQAQVKTLENQIDQLVYKLYDLTPEEIEIVEGFNEGKRETYTLLLTLSHHHP